MGRRSFRFGAALCLAVATPVALSAAVDPRAGDTVFDPVGNVVGTIRSANASTAVVWTGSMKVTLGLSSFSRTRKGLRIGMSRSQLEAAASEVQARGDDDLRRHLTPGAEIRGSDGAVLATVDRIEGDAAILAVGTAKVRFPLSAFSRDRTGVRIGMTATELGASITAQMPPPPPPPPPPSGAPEPPAEETPPPK